MMNMLIQLDEERVLADRKYDLADMWRIIDKQFVIGCKKETHLDSSAIYVGDENNDCFSSIALAYTHLREQEWFAEYCIKWEWQDDDGVENLIEKEKQDNSLFSRR